MTVMHRFVLFFEHGVELTRFFLNVKLSKKNLLSNILIGNQIFQAFQVESSPSTQYRASRQDFRRKQKITISRAPADAMNAVEA